MLICYFFTANQILLISDNILSRSFTHCYRKCKPQYIIRESSLPVLSTYEAVKKAFEAWTPDNRGHARAQPEVYTTVNGTGLSNGYLNDRVKITSNGNSNYRSIG